MKVAMVGSLHCDGGTSQVVQNAIEGTQAGDIIITGELPGVEALVRAIAPAIGRQIVVCPGTWRDGDDATSARNALLLEAAEQCYAFVDTSDASRDALDCIQQFRRAGKEVKTHWLKLPSNAGHSAK